MLEIVLLTLTAGSFLIIMLVRLDHQRFNRLYQQSQKTVRQDEDFDANEHIHLGADVSGKDLAILFTDIQMNMTSVLITEDLAESIKKLVTMYLMGAIDMIGKQKNCTETECRELIDSVLFSNLYVSLFCINKYYAGDSIQADEHRSVMNIGAIAAKFWLREEAVPEGFTLRSQLQLYDLVA